MKHEQRIFLMTLASGLPGSVAALWILWTAAYPAKVQWTATVFVITFWLGFALAVRERTILPLQTLANLLEALREGDYSIRGRQPPVEDALGEVMTEVNALGEILRNQRFDAVDAAQLLQTVIEEIDVAVFTFDEERSLRLVNRAGERLMARPAKHLLGQTAEDLGLAAMLEGEAVRTFEQTFPGQTGRWQYRRSNFREAGSSRHLLVLSDLSKALRDEERQAWQRLIRVLSHEIKNSLAPIKSTASTLQGLLHRDHFYDDWREDSQRALQMIAARCESLNRFIAAYSRLARLPAPRRRPIRIAPLIKRVAALETRLPIEVHPGPDLSIAVDGDQLEQLLINLVKNGVEASLENDGHNVEIDWRSDHGGGHDQQLIVTIRDQGPGVPPTNNLFVPFFTTKPGGTGIGLVLSRQIAEAHGGSLNLSNREDRPGCEARLRLPIPELARDPASMPASSEKV